LYLQHAEVQGAHASLKSSNDFFAKQMRISSSSSSTPRPSIEGAYEPGMFYSNLKRNSINAIRIETGQIAEGCTQKNLCLLEFGTAK
jgi:hypothetical protein